MSIQATARLKYVSVPPRKMRLVASLVKGRPVEQALNILQFTPKIAARHMFKTLKSAIVNALASEGTDHLQAEDLFVRNIIVDEATNRGDKRIRFQSMGRVYRYKKRRSHLTIIVEATEEAIAPARPARATKAAKGDQADEKSAKKKAPAKKKTAAKSTAKKKTTAKKTAKKTASKAKTTSKSKTTKAKTTTKKAASDKGE